MNKKLYRSRNDKMLAGVCGGLAEYFDFDPVIVRLIFVITIFFGGTGILAYIILWIVVPEAPLIFNMPPGEQEFYNPGFNPNPIEPDEFARQMQEKKQKRSLIIGIVLILIGILFFLNTIMPDFSFRHYAPVLLIILGAALLIKR
ncbi:MAG: PspC domain-containing protein [Syntrophothermus sp.]|nr:PspC domain-containing protein [Ignavibacteriaceae bacterium]